MIRQLDGMMEVVFVADNVTQESDVRTTYNISNRTRVPAVHEQ
jgi:hypothetical protein